MLLATAARRVLTVAWLYPALQRGRYSTVTPVASGPGKPPPPRRPSSSAGALAEAFASLDGDIGPSGSSASGDASRLKVNAQTKTISTAVGDLPISPVMDADFYSARARWRGMKRRPATVRDKKVAGRFRRVLAKNPFARALATPLRLDVLTQVRLPSFFLQDFNLVRHPATGDVWWVPYSLPREPESDNGSRERDAVSSETADKVADVSSEAGQDAAVPPCGDMGHEAASADQSPSPALTVPESMQTTRRRGGTNGRRRPPGPTRYALLSLRALSLLRTQRGLAQRFAATGQASPRWDNVLSGGGKGRNRGAVVREDVGESVILALLRADVARELLGVAESQAAEEEQERFGKADECSDGAKRRKAREFMVRLGAWDEVNAKMRRGCVLWLGDGANTGAGPGAYATIDLPHRSYFSKLPVYNIPKLLGDGQLERLRKGSAVFRDNILVGLHNLYTLRLQQKLWRLQGLVSEG